MFKRAKALFNKQLDKMENFDSNNGNIKNSINNNNLEFTTNLIEKVSTSTNNISNIRNSIQNTKL